MALVATPLQPDEGKGVVDVAKAVDKEYDELRRIKSWDESRVMEWCDINRLAKNTRRRICC